MDAMVAAFCHDDIAARLIELIPSSALYDKYVELWKKYKKNSPYFINYTYVLIWYNEHYAQFCIAKTTDEHAGQFRIARTINDYHDRCVIPESEFPDAFYKMFDNALYVGTLETKWLKPNMIASLLSNPNFKLFCRKFLDNISTLSPADLLAVSKHCERKEVFNSTYSFNINPIDFSTIWCNMSSSLRVFGVLLAGLLFKTGDDLEQMLKSNANFNSCECFCFGFLPFDMDLQPFFNYFKSLPKWPETISFAYFTNSQVSFVFEEKSASLFEVVKRLNPRKRVTNCIRFSTHPNGSQLICVISFSVDCNWLNDETPPLNRETYISTPWNLFML